MPVLATVVAILLFAAISNGHPLTGETRPPSNELGGRSLPISFVSETFLQQILRTDTQKCLLKMVCTVGANITRFGTYGDAISSYFGYFYNPFDFTVSEIPQIFNKSRSTLQSFSTVPVPEKNQHAVIANHTVPIVPAVKAGAANHPNTTRGVFRLPYSFFRNTTVVKPYGNLSSVVFFRRPETARSVDAAVGNVLFTDDFIRDFNFNKLDGDEVHGRSGFPAVFVFNRAFVQGYKNGNKFCQDTFSECNVDVDVFLNFASNLMDLTRSNT